MSELLSSVEIPIKQTITIVLNIQRKFTLEQT